MDGVELCGSGRLDLALDRGYRQPVPRCVDKQPSMCKLRRIGDRPRRVAKEVAAVGRFVLDFYCAAAKCGFEVDGIAHDMGDRAERDAARDEFIARQGIRVVRIPASEVLADPIGIAEAMVRMCRGIVSGQV